MYDIDNLVLVDDHGERKIFWYTYHYTKENYHEFTNDNYYKFELRHTKRELNIAGEVISTKEGKKQAGDLDNSISILSLNWFVKIMITCFAKVLAFFGGKSF